LSALSFITISLIGTVPYILVQSLSFIDALFESVSGFTTTGLTVLTNLDTVSRSLLIWRAETQWIGGLGIVLLFLIIVSAMRKQDSLKETTTKARAIARLYQAQGASEKLEANMKKSVRHTIFIYTGYTIAGILLLWFFGLSFFESLTTSFTSISTGGFMVTDTFYTSWPIIACLVFLMLAGSISWVLHNRLFRGYFREFFMNRSVKLYAILLVVVIAGFTALTGSFKKALFETVSAMTTTGFSISDISAFPVMVVFLIMFCMLIGGMLGSTAGGIKVNRLRLMLKSIPWVVKKAAAPSGAIIPLKSGKRVYTEEDILVVHAFTLCYVVVLFIGTIILLLTGLSFLDASFQTVSALGVVGLSTTSPAAFHVAAKLTLIVAMLLGRLEIIPVLVLTKFLHESIRTRIRKKQEKARKLFYIRWSPSELWKRKL